MKSLSAVILASALLTVPALAQQRPSTSSPAAQETANADAARHTAHDKTEHCAAMEKKMGTGPMHDHAEMKGTVAISTMNRQHLECKRMKKKALKK